MEGMEWSPETDEEPTDEHANHEIEGMASELYRIAEVCYEHYSACRITTLSTRVGGTEVVGEREHEPE